MPNPLLERRVHLRLGDRAGFFESSEKPPAPANSPLDHRAPPLRQHSRQISRDSARGDMRRAFDAKFAE